MKIFGLRKSGNTRRVLLVCEELKIPYDLIEVNTKTGENKTPEYIQEFHAFGQIPVMDDDGFRLFESRAIGRYLVNKYGKESGLIPFEDPKSLALFEQAASIEQSNFESFAKKLSKVPVDQAPGSELYEQLKQNLKGYDVLLGKHEYIAGKNLTLIDLFHLPYGTRFADAGHVLLSSQDTPNVARWWADICKRSSWLALKSTFI